MLKALNPVEGAWAVASSVWDHDFTDLPWIRQPLRLNLSTPCLEPRLRTLFGGLECLPEGHWELEDGRQVPAIPVIDSEGWVQWSHGTGAETAGSLCRALTLVQSPDAQDPAQCVAMQAEENNGPWLVLYNSLDRARALQAELWKRFEAKGIRTGNGLLPLLDSLLESRISQASALLETDADLRNAQATVRGILARFQLEWNSHGLKRTFGHWSRARKQAYLLEAVEVMDHLRSISDGVCLGFGAVLGWRRDRDLIAHDDDLDVLVAFDRTRVPDLGRALRQVECELRERGCIIKGRFFAHLWVQLSEHSTQTLDVFVGLIEGSELSFYPSKRTGLQLSEVFPAAPQDLLGVSVAMPAQIEGYLEATYGCDWMKPERGFAHPWDRDQYADIAGHRPRAPMWTRGELQQQRKRAALPAVQ